jgi:ABC-type uncharacterized transport system involved in gliding motility auxiliary subunit
MKFIPSKPLLHNIAFIALLCLAAITLYQLAARHPRQWDFTQSGSNTLESGSVDVLQQMQGEIKLTVYATSQDANQGDMHKLIRDFVALYQRYKPDISLAFIDPVKQPEEARRVNIQANGEMLVQYGGRVEHLTVLSEQALTSALLRLAHSKDKLLMYLDGHGERKLEGIANHDLGEFGKRLQQNGYRVSSLNLTIAQDVPANASMLLITHPQIDLLPGEVDKLLRYVARGGNLLWLVDAEPLHGLEPLAEKLGLLLTSGIVIDPAAEEMRAPANWALAAGYPPHPVTRNFNLITVFPFSRALGLEENETWQRTTLVEAAPRGWVSSRTAPIISSPTDIPATTGALDEPSRSPATGTPGKTSQLHFDKSRDVPGPAIIALALQRDVNDRDQRIVVVGGGSFLANAYSGNGGNLDLGLNMVNWLAFEEKLIIPQPRSVKDSTINLSKTRLAVISAGFVLVLPAILLLVGGGLWWRRR